MRIRITLKDTFPKVLLVRREDDPKSVYFGPYPSSGSLKLVLKTIRRVFPYQSVLNHPKRICLYNHLGLCPCPPLNDTPEMRLTYRKNIRGIIRILEGESKNIMKELERERDEQSKKEEYERALLVQKKINALSLITTPFHRPFEYDVNPNLRVDIRSHELDGLMEALNQHGLGLKQLERIECYDISNTQGTHATGSMVVFINGEKESSQYRKFRIRREWERSLTRGKIDKELPNDFAMMKEVLKRRFKHDEWNMPSLVIVDGGKGQVSSAMTALAESGISVPLIGLAKREETIVIPKALKALDTHGTLDTFDTLNFEEVSLPKNSPSLHLIMRIRDEAHRFAITYHRKLRSKNALSSTKLQN